jgi:hypothetical protein
MVGALDGELEGAGGIEGRPVQISNASDRPKFLWRGDVDTEIFIKRDNPPNSKWTNDLGKGPVPRYENRSKTQSILGM